MLIDQIKEDALRSQLNRLDIAYQLTDLDGYQVISVTEQEATLTLNREEQTFNTSELIPALAKLPKNPDRHKGIYDISQEINALRTDLEFND